MREIVILACSECKRRNYTTTKNKKTMTGKLEIKKYCKFDKKHTLHKETKQSFQFWRAYHIPDSNLGRGEIMLRYSGISWDIKNVEDLIRRV